MIQIVKPRMMGVVLIAILCCLSIADPVYALRVCPLELVMTSSTGCTTITCELVGGIIELDGSGGYSCDYAKCTTVTISPCP